MRREGGPPPDTDLAERMQWLAITATAIAAGLGGGAAIGFLLFRWPALQGALILGLPCGFVAFAAGAAIIEGSGAVAGWLHAPGGTARRYELSREEALIEAGRLEEAAAALVDACERYRSDPRPRIMLAELHRDRLDDPREAASWYRRAASMPDLSLDSERMLLRELVELARDRIGRREVAAPALARAAHLHAGDRLGHWARAQLREIRGARNGAPSGRAGSGRWQEGEAGEIDP